MKLKRFLAIVVTLTMVLSIVPAFSLTVGAADVAGMLDTLAESATVVFDGSYSAIQGPGSASAIGNYYTGWTGQYSTSDGSYAEPSNYATTGLQVYSKQAKTESSASNKNYLKFQDTGSPNHWSMVTTPGYKILDTVSADNLADTYVMLEWVHQNNYGSQDAFYGEFWFYDTTGAGYPKIFWDKNSAGEARFGNQNLVAENNALERVIVVNGSDAANPTHTTYFQLNTGSGYQTTSTVEASGFIDGFGSMKVLRGQWNTDWTVIALGDFTVSVGELPSEETSATVNYVYNSNTLKTETVEGLFPETAWTPATPGSGMIVIGDTAYDIVFKTSIDSLSATASENVATVTLERKFGIVKSFIENSDFETGDLTGWDNLSADWFEVQNGDNGIGEKILYAKANGWQSHEDCAIGGVRSFQKLVTGIEFGKVYYYTADVYTGSNTGLWMNYSFLNSETAMTYGNTGNLYVTDGAQTNCTTDACASGTQLSNNYKQQWHTFSGFVTADDVSKAFEFDVYYLHDSPGSKIDNVAFYETDIVAANTTIKFVDSSNTSVEVGTAATVKGFVGDVIDLTAYGEATYTHNGNLYSRDDTNKTSHTVTTANDVVTITYTTDAVTSINPVSTTVIEGNDPVLPATVTGITGKGAETPVAITWGNHTNLTAGTHTITGTADGISVTATATVTVLAKKFEVPNLSSTNGAIAFSDAFPGEVTGDFAVEFDYTSSQNGDDWIYISQNQDQSGMWGSGNLAIGVGTNKLKAPNSLGGSPAEQMTTTFVVGETYRILAKGNTLSNSYSLTVTAEDGTVLNDGSETYYFRANDTTNGKPLNYINIRGGFEMSNIKVYAPSVALTEYTIVATGSVSETTKVMAKSAEIVPIPHYDGHIMKTRTISGTTITATYEATTTSVGSWYMRNNFTDDNWISQSKYIGSHNAFADDDSAFINEGGALYGDTGASTTGTTAVSNSQTQSVRVLDQLNAGVRYFDIRLSRQKDGTFATIHGPAFENFRDVAISMAQWAKENPGEVIILDFQTMRDALYGGSATGHYDVITDNDAQYGPDEGDDNAYVYAALVQLFKDTGLADYMTTNWDRKYGALTNSGTVTAILPFGKGRAVNCQNGYFANRSALNNDVTYTESSSYSTIVSNLDSTYTNLTGGPTISTVHAYTTPFSLFGSGDLIQDAQDNNPNWINEDGFYNWMGYDKGDVFMMNDSVSDIDLYYNALNKFNRTGSSYSYTENFIRTDDNVTINGAQDRVPFSTKWTVEPSAATGTYTIDGVTYTAVTAYELDLMQFNTDSVQPTGEVTVTFPKVSADDTTVDVLLSADGSTVYATAKRGEGVSIATTALADVIVATKVAPYEDVTVKLMSNGSQVGTCEVRVYEGDSASVPAGVYAKQYYLDAETVATVNGSEYTVEVSPLTSFTWEKSSNSALTTNGTYNAGRVVYWGSNTTNRTGYAYATVPAHNAEQTVMMTLDVMYNNGFNRDNSPVGKFYTVNREELKAIDLAGGADTTTALDALAATEIATIDFYTVITSDDTDKAVAVDGKEYTHAVITVPVTEIAAGDIAVKMHDDGNQSGIAVINNVTFAIANAVSVDGVTTYVNNGDSITVKPADGSAGLIDGAGTIFAGETTFVPTKNIELSSAGIGAHMIDGAQVRIGYGPNSDGKVGSESGLRFITLVDTADSLAYEIYANHYNAETKTFADGYEIGVKITAEGSTAVAVKIPATLWQTEGEVFTSALTNLAESNFNRKFTATPYVTINGVTIDGNTTSERSIYQVAAGLLAKTSTDGTEYDQSALQSTVLYKVLNAYVNQTGIRLQITDSGLAAYEYKEGEKVGASYSGDVFFEVVSTNKTGNIYTAIIKPVGTKTTINDYWKEYIRINNNNKQVVNGIDVESKVNEDGTLTLTFDASLAK